jgi:hypothetical protein
MEYWNGKRFVVTGGQEIIMAKTIKEMTVDEIELEINCLEHKDHWDNGDWDRQRALKWEWSIKKCIEEMCNEN